MENDAKVTVSFAGGGSIRDAVTAVEFAVETKRMSELIWVAAFVRSVDGLTMNGEHMAPEVIGALAKLRADRCVEYYHATRATVPK